MLGLNVEGAVGMEPYEGVDIPEEAGPETPNPEPPTPLAAIATDGDKAVSKVITNKAFFMR